MCTVEFLYHNKRILPVSGSYIQNHRRVSICVSGISFNKDRENGKTCQSVWVFHLQIDFMRNSRENSELYIFPFHAESLELSNYKMYENVSCLNI
jgi:hypothetical protein